MYRDPIVEEVRRIRKEIEAQYQNNPKKYYDHLVEIEKQYESRLVRRKPKPALNLAS